MKAGRSVDTGNFVRRCRSNNARSVSAFWAPYWLGSSDETSGASSSYSPPAGYTATLDVNTYRFTLPDTAAAAAITCSPVVPRCQSYTLSYTTSNGVLSSAARTAVTSLRSQWISPTRSPKGWPFPRCMMTTSSPMVSSSSTSARPMKSVPPITSARAMPPRRCRSCAALDYTSATNAAVSRGAMPGSCRSTMAPGLSSVVPERHDRWDTCRATRRHVRRHQSHDAEHDRQQRERHCVRRADAEEETRHHSCQAERSNQAHRDPHDDEHDRL